jgi:glycosyltransferase involved in cell wall biosynthesis
LEDTSILFIVMEFLPLNLGGVFRPLRFVNGLNKHHIRPIIITFADDDQLRKVHSRFDYALLDKLDKTIPVYRIPLNDMDGLYDTRLKRFKNIYFNVGDNYLAAWKDNLLKELPAIIEKHQPKAVFVTSPPYSAAVLGAEISKKFSLPLILDMRDAWAKLWTPVGSYFHYKHREKLERNAFRQASAVITVTPRLKTVFQETHPQIEKEKFRLIYNGFDFELPESLSVKSESIDVRKVINIGYIGEFYYSPAAREMMLLPWWKKKGHRMLQYAPVKEDWLYRSPYFFLKALAALIKRRPEWKSKIFFHHIGVKPEWLEPMAAELGLKENIIFHGFQTLEAAIVLQKSFDLLLATSEKVIGNEHFCLPSKLFTYLRSGKPVLGFVTRGVQYDFIDQSGIGIINDPDDELSASANMEDIFSKGYNKELNIPYLKQFANAEAIDKLINLVRQVVKS